MDCTKCAAKGCRKSTPCKDSSEEYLHLYATPEIRTMTKAASELIDNGRAGTLTRLEEISEYCKLRGYLKIGVAYCYGMEKEASLLREYLYQQGLKPLMISCTVDGVKESQIDPAKTKNIVSCNPLGQANQLNASGAEFTILMGLCLGHDILLQKNLTMDFTTFVVKDRVTKHAPMLGLPGYLPQEDVFLESLPSDFYLINQTQFKEKMLSSRCPDDLMFLDLRGTAAYEADGIPGSIQCLLKDLPKHYRTLFPDRKKEIILYCNGGIQSVYGVMYLRMKGYLNVRSLTGGISKYLQK